MTTSWCSAKQIKDLFPGCQYLLAFEQKRPVGFAIVRDRGDYVEIAQMPAKDKPTLMRLMVALRARWPDKKFKGVIPRTAKPRIAFYKSMGAVLDEDFEMPGYEKESYVGICLA